MNIINNEQSAAKPLLNEERSETIPNGSTLLLKEEKVALFNFYVLIDPRDNNVKYVGRTVNTSNRYRNHIYEAKKNNRNKRERWIMYLLKNNMKPILRVIHSRICNINKAIEIEKRLVLYFSKYINLKNEPDNYLGAVLTGKKVYRYSLNGEYIDSFYNASQAMLKTGIKDSNIGRCCKKLQGYGVKSAGGYLWSYIKYKNYPIRYSPISMRKHGLYYQWGR